jgi:hypothetical protein
LISFILGCQSNPSEASRDYLLLPFRRSEQLPAVFGKYIAVTPAFELCHHGQTSASCFCALEREREREREREILISLWIRFKVLLHGRTPLLSEQSRTVSLAKLNAFGTSLLTIFGSSFLRFFRKHVGCHGLSSPWTNCRQAVVVVETWMWFVHASCQYGSKSLKPADAESKIAAISSCSLISPARDALFSTSLCSSLLQRKPFLELELYSIWNAKQRQVATGS